LNFIFAGYSPDSSKKPFEKKRQIFLTENSDQRKLILCLENCCFLKKLVANSWNSSKKEL
jgi:hypothetical protein